MSIVPHPQHPQFHVPVRFSGYNLDQNGNAAGSLGVIKKFNSTDGSPSIAVKKFTLPFQSKSRASLVLRELNLLKSIRQANGHSNIVRLIDMYTVEGRAEEMQSIYHITEHCGVPLSTMIRNAGYKMESVKKWMRELLSALQFINTMGISHRNLHPDTMCINSEPLGKLTLLGFGKARVLADDANTCRRGKNPYMALEMQINWTETYDEKVDIWSMCTILCELLTGVPLFDPNEKNVLRTMLRLCGPVEVAVINRMARKEDRECFTKESLLVQREDFIALLKRRSNQTRGITEEDIEKEPHLKDFIDRTLQFNSRRRMSAHRAVCHPFLTNTNSPVEVPLPQEEDDGIEECRQHIWSVIHG